ncbi:hypothetical protein ACFSKW_47595 [Nonomuraea mangrovi]|uniref:MFS transporter n=1 Tax=Nonomuraea mangrovi TaxID=2316207 RepID=A0ABW4TBR2_9ACTN
MLPATLTGFAIAGGFGSVMLYTAMAALSDHQGRDAGAGRGDRRLRRPPRPGLGGLARVGRASHGRGPFALGALADGYGTNTAFLMVPVLAGLAAGGVLSARRPA